MIRNCDVWQFPPCEKDSRPALQETDRSCLQIEARGLLLSTRSPEFGSAHSQIGQVLSGLQNTSRVFPDRPVTFNVLQ